jgi:hypothetical protein
MKIFIGNPLLKIGVKYIYRRSSFTTSVYTFSLRRILQLIFIICLHLPLLLHRDLQHAVYIDHQGFEWHILILNENSSGKNALLVTKRS